MEKAQPPNSVLRRGRLGYFTIVFGTSATPISESVSFDRLPGIKKLLIATVNSDILE